MPPKKKKVGRPRKSQPKRKAAALTLLPDGHPLTPYIEHPTLGIVDRLRSDVLAAINQAGTLSGGFRVYNQHITKRGHPRVSLPMWSRWIRFLGISRRDSFVSAATTPATSAEPAAPQFDPDEPVVRIQPPAQEGVQPELTPSLFDGLSGQPDREPVYPVAGLSGINNVLLPSQPGQP
jgi:hypothetical protein